LESRLEIPEKVLNMVPVHHKTDGLGFQAFFREKFYLWVGNGSGVEEIWKSHKDIIFEGIKRYVPHTILSKIPKPEYYNKKIKR
jgi:hypothetical protein